MDEGSSPLGQRRSPKIKHLASPRKARRAGGFSAAGLAPKKSSSRAEEERGRRPCPFEGEETMLRDDRDVHQLRRRFVEGLLQNMPPSALRRYVMTGIARADERTGSGRNKAQR